jgi:hypothetical protein
MRLRVSTWFGWLTFALASWPASSRADDLPVSWTAETPRIDEPPDPPEPESNPRVWTFGLRAGAGVAVFDRVNLCLLDSYGCPNDNWMYLLASVESVATFGRPNAHVRWRSWMDFVYGPATTENAGKLFAGRLQTGLEARTNPESPSTLVFELGGGASYYAVDQYGVSVPMFGVSLALGSYYRGFEIMGRVNLDTILLESFASGTVQIGWAF